MNDLQYLQKGNKKPPEREIMVTIMAFLNGQTLVQFNMRLFKELIGKNVGMLMYCNTYWITSSVLNREHIVSSLYSVSEISYVKYQSFKKLDVTKFKSPPGGQSWF